MNRTTVILGSAVVLLLVALVFGVPRPSQPTVSPVDPVQPVSPPTVVVPPVVVTDLPGSLSLTGRLSHPYIPNGTSDLFATLEVNAVDVPGAKRAPVNLAVVIDRSGSMSGSKIANARRAAIRLVDSLNEGDRLAIVHYGNDARVFPAQFCTPGVREEMKRYIANIVDEGGTNIGEGLIAARDQLQRMISDFRVNRIMLLSDGQPTVGMTSPAQLKALVSRIRGQGVTVTALGLGSDFNEDLMTGLADNGGGAYGFIDDDSATARIFEKELQQATASVARAVSVRFDVPSGVTFREVYGRPFITQGSSVVVQLPDFSARQSEKIIVRFTADGSGRPSLDIGTFGLSYTDVLHDRLASTSTRLSAVVTADASAVMNSRDKNAFVDAKRAQAAQNQAFAAQAMERGDLDDAKHRLKANEDLYAESESLAGADAVKADRAQNNFFFGLSSTPAPSAAEGQTRIKMMKKGSLLGTGRSADSVY